MYRLDESFILCTGEQLGDVGEVLLHLYPEV